MLVLLPLVSSNIGIFLHRWWFLRKRLSRDWGLSARDGISQTDFLRLLITVTTVIIFYLPISIVILIINLLLPRHPYSWDGVHGPQWGVIAKPPRSSVGWASWVGPLSALNFFSLMGITRASRKLFDLGVEWVYDHLPSLLQRRFLWMRNISAKCKQSRLAEATDANLLRNQE